MFQLLLAAFVKKSVFFNKKGKLSYISNEQLNCGSAAAFESGFIKYEELWEIC